MTRARRQADEGLSSVLGAILLFGLLVSTLATVQVRYVPVWDAEREGRLMDGLSQQMAQLQADVARQVTNRTDTPVGLPLTLAPEGGFTFFTGSSEPGTIAFHPAVAGAGLRLGSTRLTIQNQDGLDLYVLSEDWRSVVHRTNITGVVNLDHLRIRIPDPTPLTNGQFVSLTLADDLGRYQGKLVVTKTLDQSEAGLLVQAFSAQNASAPITELMDGWKKTVDSGAFYMDVLDPSLGFAAIAAAAPKPLTLSWATTIAPSNIQAALVYTSETAGRMGAAGLVVPNFNHLADGGRIEASRHNQQFPEQSYVLEYGALIVVQPDGAAMAVPPAFSVRSTPTQVAIGWAVPELTGPPSTIGGTRTAQVSAVPLGSRLDLHAFAPHLTLSLATEHPQVWADYWQGVLHEAGLRAPGHYRITEAVGIASLEVFGPSGLAGVNDLYLDYKEATLALTLLPTG